MPLPTEGNFQTTGGHKGQACVAENEDRGTQVLRVRERGRWDTGWPESMLGWGRGPTSKKDEKQSSEGSQGH